MGGYSSGGRQLIKRLPTFQPPEDSYPALDFAWRDESLQRGDRVAAMISDLTKLGAVKQNKISGAEVQRYRETIRAILPYAQRLGRTTRNAKILNRVEGLKKVLPARKLKDYEPIKIDPKSARKSAIENSPNQPSSFSKLSKEQRAKADRKKAPAPLTKDGRAIRDANTRKLEKKTRSIDADGDESTSRSKQTWRNGLYGKTKPPPKRGND